jgi:hypothetical protein
VAAAAEHLDDAGDARAFVGDDGGDLALHIAGADEDGGCFPHLRGWGDLVVEHGGVDDAVDMPLQKSPDLVRGDVGFAIQLRVDDGEGEVSAAGGLLSAEDDLACVRSPRASRFGW